MTDMIERVARAIKTYWYEASGAGGYIVCERGPKGGMKVVKGCETITEARELTDRLNARAAIAAMRAEVLDEAEYTGDAAIVRWLTDCAALGTGGEEG